MSHSIKDGAIFIADAHFSSERQDLLLLLSKIESNIIDTKQIFFMGDIFDLLIPPIKHTLIINSELIDAINRLSISHEVYFFEGNHDFLLHETFPNVILFPLMSQPAIFDINGKTALLLHGDRFAPASYLVYSSLIRSRFVLNILRFILFDFISPKFINFVIAKLKNKNICKKQQNFYEFILKRLPPLVNKYSFDYLIEGHFHQGKNFEVEQKNYINIASFACNKSFFRVEFNKSEIKFLDEQL